MSSLNCYSIFLKQFSYNRSKSVFCTDVNYHCIEDMLIQADMPSLAMEEVIKSYYFINFLCMLLPFISY